MRILIHTLNYSPELTGIGKYNGEMAESLSARGHDVRIITAPPYYPQWQVLKGYSSWKYRKEKFGDITVWRCPLWVPKKLSGLKRILHLASFAFFSFPILLFHAFWRPHIIIVIEPPLFCAPNVLLVSWVCNARSWLHIQDFEVDAAFDLDILSSDRLRRAVLSVERWLMRRFDVVSTISMQMMKRLNQKEVGQHKQVYFPNWVDVNKIFPLDDDNFFRKTLKIVQSDVVFLYSGNMGEKQGLDIIVEAAKHLRGYKRIKFVLCGSGAAYLRLRSMAGELPNIHWMKLQPLDKLNELLNMADVHLLPQRAGVEDLVMPSKLTGMMASGIPVLATAGFNTQIASVLQGAGIVVSPENLSEFLSAIKDLAENKKCRDELGINARKYALAHLSRSTILSEFEKKLYSLITG